MQMKNQHKKKGVADVKDNSQATMLHTKNVLDMSAMGITRAGSGEWDEFEVMGSSDQQEGDYRSPQGSELDLSSLHERIRCSHVGRKILALSSLA